MFAGFRVRSCLMGPHRIHSVSEMGGKELYHLLPAFPRGHFRFHPHESVTGLLEIFSNDRKPAPNSGVAPPYHSYQNVLIWIQNY